MKELLLLSLLGVVILFAHAANEEKRDIRCSEDLQLDTVEFWQVVHSIPIEDIRRMVDIYYSDKRYELFGERDISKELWGPIETPRPLPPVPQSPRPKTPRQFSATKKVGRPRRKNDNPPPSSKDPEKEEEKSA